MTVYTGCDHEKAISSKVEYQIDATNSSRRSIVDSERISAARGGWDLRLFWDDQPGVNPPARDMPLVHRLPSGHWHGQAF